MGCGCAKRGVRSTLSPRNSRTRLRAAAIKAGIVAQNTRTVQAQSKKPVPIDQQVTIQSQPPSPNRSPSGLSEERRLVEKRRRDAIRKRLGKG